MRGSTGEREKGDRRIMGRERVRGKKEKGKREEMGERGKRKKMEE